MPRYEYECKPCKLEFEQDATIDKRDTISCSQCGRFATRKPAAPMFGLAGAGFHDNDYPGQKRGTHRTEVRRRKERE